MQECARRFLDLRATPRGMVRAASPACAPRAARTNERPVCRFAIAANPFAGNLGKAQELACISQELGPRGGQAHGMSIPPQEHNAGGILQLPKLSADGGLRGAQCAGRGRYAAALGNANECAQ